MAIVKEVNPHFEEFLFDWDYKINSMRIRCIKNL